jgi:phospho-N-acetylmuramoyl-pentapeptide-transferase
MANFVNITDGLDGLAAGLAVILALALAAAAIILGDALPYPNFALLYCSLAGAALGFLWFNVNPAEVFMGDAGSLAIGALIAVLAIVMELEMVTVVAGMIFIADGMSSALQWAVFKYTRIRTGTGKRLWRMSPIHHHYELCGVPEPLIVARFWILGLLCAAWALMIAVARAWLGR